MLINVYKPVAKTPLQVIKKIKKLKPELKNKKIGYAGRLDPMAEGVLLLMVEPETKNRNKYQDLDKVYEFDILFGIETDSLDILGLITEKNEKNISKDDLRNELRDLTGEIKLPYPIYSSKPVKSKPLYWWARRGKLNEIDIPINKTEIYSIELLEMNKIPAKELKEEIFKKLDLIEGDFRQNKIEKRWKKYFKNTANNNFQTAKLIADVSSGTYIRSLSKKIANDLGTLGIALNIKRLRVGEFEISGSNNFFNHSY